MSGVLPRRLWSLALVPVVLVGVAVYTLVAGPGPTPTGFPSVGGSFDERGPFEVSVDDVGDHTLFFPSDVGDDDRRHPVVLWGNATGGDPGEYGPLLRHLASHGFIVAAADTGFAGEGVEMVAGLDHLELRDAADDGPFAGAVDTGRVGAAGHSQGADGAMATAGDGRVGTVVAVQAWEGDPAGVGVPALFLAGEGDRVAEPARIRAMFEGVGGAPAAYAELDGADHLEPTDDGGSFRGALTAWLRWQLMEDPSAEDWFVGDGCTLCTSDDWRVYETNDAFAGDGADR